MSHCRNCKFDFSVGSLLFGLYSVALVWIKVAVKFKSSEEFTGRTSLLDLVVSTRTATTRWHLTSNGHMNETPPTESHRDKLRSLWLQNKTKKELLGSPFTGMVPTCGLWSHIQTRPDSISFTLCTDKARINRKANTRWRFMVLGSLYLLCSSRQQ